MVSAHALGRAEKLARAGAGVGGSGGAEAGRCADHVVEDATHLVAFEKRVQIAEAVGEWLGAELTRWKEGEAENDRRGGWSDLPDADRANNSDECKLWMARNVQEVWGDTQGAEEGDETPMRVERHCSSLLRLA